MDFRVALRYRGAQQWRWGMESLSMRTVWLVFRTDENGTRFLVQGKFDLAEADAQAFVEAFTQRGHKQTYEKLPYQYNKFVDVLVEHDIRRT
jgi:hypothetical protein